MRNISVYKCPLCDFQSKTAEGFEEHMRNAHPGEIPEGWSIRRYYHYVLTGKTHGTCRMCKKETPWIEETGRYAVLCGSEKCKKAFREDFEKNTKKKYGSRHVMDRYEVQHSMLIGRSQTQWYTYHDGTKIPYTGTLEGDFLKMLDTFLRYPSCDIIAPSPHMYIYYYENPNEPDQVGNHLYIPDFYFPSMNLDVEIKTCRNIIKKFIAIDDVKEMQKDEAMKKQNRCNYVKIYEKDYTPFFTVLHLMRDQLPTDRPTKTFCVIPDKPDYYNTNVSQQNKAAEKAAKESYVENDITLESYMSNPYHDSDTDDIIFEKEMDTDPDYTMEQFSFPEFNDVDPDAPEVFVGENLSVIQAGKALEALLDDMLEKQEDSDAKKGYSSQYVKNAERGFKWRDKLFKNHLFGDVLSKVMVKVTNENGYIKIKGINCNLLITRIKVHYNERQLTHILEKNYNAKSLKQYNKKKISRGEMKIDSLYAPEFFCMELCILFRDLAKRFRDASYLYIAQQIYEKSWMAKADSKIDNTPLLDLSPLSNIDRKSLKEYQKEFIQVYPRLKAQLNLKGYILGFVQGLGKTLTSIGLAECLHATKVYIVCPNSLTENWANEIREYYSKYFNSEELWKQDVCIVNKKFGNPDTAKFLIVNNESIPKLTAIAKKDPNAMLILDESHNFRNFDGKHSHDLYTLAEKIGSDNNLIMSGTPIKAVPAEIVPILYILDPTFTEEAAMMYIRCFNLNTTSAIHVADARFGKLIYRKDKSVLSLPDKKVQKLAFPVSDEPKYYLETVTTEVRAKYAKFYEEMRKNSADLEKELVEIVDKYSMASADLTTKYISLATRVATDISTTRRNIHETEQEFLSTFLDRYVRANPQCDSTTMDRLRYLERKFVHMKDSAMGKAIGEVIPPRRAEVFIKLWKENRDTFIDMIKKCPKKTVIFSQLVPVIEAIHEDLTACGVGTVIITGDTKDRYGEINKFRHDPNVVVICATSKTIGTGVTLTEASQMLFFGPPWRYTDFEQCCDRIHRIGQTDPVTIYIVSMKSTKKNLTNRMQEIVSWSQEMFNTAIKVTDLGDIPDPDNVDDEIVEESLYGTDYSYFDFDVVQEYYAEDNAEEEAAVREALEIFNQIREDVIRNESAIDATQVALEAANYSETNKYPVFVILTQGHTPLSFIIKGATGDKHSHASIAFDIGLKHMYSFGTKKINPRELGFVETSADSKIWGEIPTAYDLYVTFINGAQKKKIRKTLEYFIQNADKLKYHWMGLVQVFLKIKSTHNQKFICSQFVATLLGAAIKLDRDPSLYRPSQLADLENVEFVIAGPSIRDYDAKVAEKALEKVKAAKN